MIEKIAHKLERRFERLAAAPPTPSTVVQFGALLLALVPIVMCLEWRAYLRGRP